ncbi:hypothetical protein M422DRAFT_271825 [Sphaerobolus stellatus SS14]|uniref:Zn(2)-C6 fungal-type domain-containing protein n=1 Tax=Sphaerobolus stellatus (strain SS14) TaxID=990650 RepID=A0A0C9UNF7_SPHS4|nr:hypothetical protein M422DRAFT_271825 [Sphaerobolus stellatus SS14]
MIEFWHIGRGAFENRTTSAKCAQTSTSSDCTDKNRTSALKRLHAASTSSDYTDENCTSALKGLHAASTSSDCTDEDFKRLCRFRKIRSEIELKKFLEFRLTHPSQRIQGTKFEEGHEQEPKNTDSSTGMEVYDHENVPKKDKRKGKSREEFLLPSFTSSVTSSTALSSTQPQSQEQNIRRPSIFRIWEDNHERNLPSSSCSAAQPSTCTQPPPPPLPSVSARLPPPTTDAEITGAAAKIAKEPYKARVRTAINSRGVHMAVVPGPRPSVTLPNAANATGASGSGSRSGAGVGGSRSAQNTVPRVPLEIGNGPPPHARQQKEDEEREERRACSMMMNANPRRAEETYESERRREYKGRALTPASSSASSRQSYAHGNAHSPVDAYERGQPRLTPPPPVHSSLSTSTHSLANDYAPVYDRGPRVYQHDRERNYQTQREYENDCARSSPSSYGHNYPSNSSTERDHYGDQRDSAPQAVSHHLSLDYQHHTRSTEEKDRKKKRRSRALNKPTECLTITIDDNTGPFNPPTRSPTLTPVANYSPSSHPSPSASSFSMFSIIEPVKTDTNYMALNANSSGSPTITRALPSLRDTVRDALSQAQMQQLLPPPPSQHATNGEWNYAEDGEYEDDEEPGVGGGAGGEERPKKKRRTRITLSYSECKRRKIKCDRMQPCTPCQKRGDQSPCKWTVNENSDHPPRDGAPTRIEFDALQARLASVERVLQSMVPNFAQAQRPIPQRGNPYSAVSPSSEAVHHSSLAYPPQDIHHAWPDPPSDRYKYHQSPSSSHSHHESREYRHGYSHAHQQASPGAIFQSSDSLVPGSSERHMMAPPSTSTSTTATTSRTTPVVKLKDLVHNPSSSNVSCSNAPTSSNAEKPVVLKLLPEALRNEKSAEKSLVLKLLPDALRNKGTGRMLQGRHFR